MHLVIKLLQLAKVFSLLLARQIFKVLMIMFQAEVSNAMIDLKQLMKNQCTELVSLQNIDFYSKF